MKLLIYSIGLILLGLANKVIQYLDGTFTGYDTLMDAPLIILTYFGVLAVYGRATGKIYFKSRFWKAYAALVSAIVLTLPLVKQEFIVVYMEFGLVTAFLAYSIPVILIFPYLLAVYQYSIMLSQKVSGQSRRHLHPY